MPDYQPQNPQPKKRYKRQTPVLHVPTRDEWRKLGQISAAVGGSLATITMLVFGYKAVSAYLMYAKDIVIQHGLLVTTIYGALTLTGLAIALLVGVPTTVRGYFAITKRHRPGYLLSTVGNSLMTLALYAGVSLTMNKAISAFVGLSRRLKDLQKPHHPIAYDVINLSADSASDAFKTYTAQTNTSFAIIATTIVVGTLVVAGLCKDKLNTITSAQELTPEEHAERQLGLNAIQKYVQNRNYQPVREQAAVLLFMYDHVHPEDWIWSEYDPNRRMRTYDKGESNELTTFFQSSTDFDNYLKRVWKTYVNGRDFKSDDSTIVIEADKIHYIDNGIRTAGISGMNDMLTHYIETANKRITDYLDL